MTITNGEELMAVQMGHADLVVIFVIQIPLKYLWIKNKICKSKIKNGTKTLLDHDLHFPCSP